MADFYASASILKALAHPLRLQIIDELGREGEACVCHLEWRIGERQAIISQQLGRLRDAGLVTDRREGMNVFYALTSPSIGALLDAASVAGDLHGSDSPTPHRSRQRKAARPCGCPKCRGKPL